MGLGIAPVDQIRGHGTGRGGNGSGRGRRTPSRGAGQIETRQLGLVYAARYHEDSDDANVIAGTFFIHSVLYYALIDIGSTHSYIASIVSTNLGLTAENTAKEFSVISPLEYCVSLDCVTKRVTLRTTENDEAVMLSMRDIRTIREFLNAFPEEFPRVPLDREVEFGIDLLLGTALVPIIPYRMSLKELTELKA
ncbi:uncharacterized protein [Gossypium hirsutum]|uniref:Uncharacterized protein n=1 Tax=Gossypium hirsutum TaxID=3635 RepID=A0A1U8JMH9_GOSHI|nr:uncharacterized protein LOC107907157 [Gossypium hirsutum]